MTKKNNLIGLRLNSEQFELIRELSKLTGFKQTNVCRWLLNKSLNELREDIRKVQGIENLTFDIKEIKRINQ